MTRSFLRNLHPDDHELWLCVEKAVWRLALAAKLPLRQVRPMPRHMVATAQGYYLKHPVNEIWISVRRGTKTKWADRYFMHQLIDTIAHEVAHLEGGWVTAHHGPEFFRAHARMLNLQEDLNIRLDLQAWSGKLNP